MTTDDDGFSRECIYMLPDAFFQGSEITPRQIGSPYRTGEEAIPDYRVTGQQEH